VGLVEHIHQTRVLGRRVRVLAETLAKRIPRGSRVLDVGCGDGLIASTILRLRPDVQIEGIDVLVRPNPAIPVHAYDGAAIPFPDRCFDVALCIDVLHHTVDPTILLRETTRVAKALLLKDHTREGLFAGARLRLMDAVGNARHGVALPFNYWSRQQWTAAIRSLELDVVEWSSDVALYPWPASLIFGTNLHFVAILQRSLWRLRGPG
jgi:SAM-dependent methyltransferase